MGSEKQRKAQEAIVAPGRAWDESLDALIAARLQHRKSLGNERVRVLEVHMPAGDMVLILKDLAPSGSSRFRSDAE